MDNLKETEKLSLIQSYEYLKSRKKIKRPFNIKKDIFFKNQRYILKNIRMKTSKLEAKPSSPKLSPTDPYQILRHREDVYVSCSRAIAIKEWRKRKHAIEPDPTIGQGDREFLKREGG